jgi:hypothetical protein
VAGAPRCDWNFPRRIRFLDGVIPVFQGLVAGRKPVKQSFSQLSAGAPAK